MKYKLALFFTGFGDPRPIGEWIDGQKGYTRVSEYVEVEFPEIPAEVATALKVAAIDELITDTTTKYQVTINRLNREKADLLCITYQPSEVAA